MIHVLTPEEFSHFVDLWNILGKLKAMPSYSIVYHRDRSGRCTEVHVEFP
jgi:hypothetical protein